MIEPPLWHENSFCAESSARPAQQQSALYSCHGEEKTEAAADSTLEPLLADGLLKESSGLAQALCGEDL